MIAAVIQNRYEDIVWPSERAGYRDKSCSQ